MRKWIALLALLLVLALASPAAAQNEVHISTLNIKLWPEYDQPTMLVIYDFQLAENIPLPMQVTFRIPLGVNVIAVAALENENLVNVNFDGPVVAGTWEEITILVEKNTTYHFEYYASIIRTGEQRRYSFQWNGEYAVDSLNLSVQQPPTATALKGTPALKAFEETDGLTYHNLTVNDLPASQAFELVVEYNKNNDTLTVPDSVIQPSAQLDENTTGRVSLSNYVPYLVGGLGVVLVASGLGYYFLFARRDASHETARRRRRQAAVTEDDPTKVIYCSQCGERTHSGDRFCRVCGTRIRQGE
ncbi:MAG: zinc ribbon domain-containing protein [Chloroflexi bacterium]|nr:zinc ribbon domain-containing protein [Chloroflexota bacterium]